MKMPQSEWHKLKSGVSRRIASNQSSSAYIICSSSCSENRRIELHAKYRGDFQSSVYLFIENNLINAHDYDSWSYV